MLLPGLFPHFELRHLFGVTAKEVVAWLDERFTDSNRTLPRAILVANQRVWHVFGLAVADESFAGWGRGAIRDADLIAARDQIRQMLASTPSGLAVSPAEIRTRAAGELATLGTRPPPAACSPRRRRPTRRR